MRIKVTIARFKIPLSRKLQNLEREISLKFSFPPHRGRNVIITKFERKSEKKDDV